MATKRTDKGTKLNEAEYDELVDEVSALAVVNTDQQTSINALSLVVNDNANSLELLPGSVDMVISDTDIKHFHHTYCYTELGFDPSSPDIDGGSLHIESDDGTYQLDIDLPLTSDVDIINLPSEGGNQIRAKHVSGETRIAFAAGPNDGLVLTSTLTLVRHNLPPLAGRMATIENNPALSITPQQYSEFLTGGWNQVDNDADIVNLEANSDFNIPFFYGLDDNGVVTGIVDPEGNIIKFGALSYDDTALSGRVKTLEDAPAQTGLLQNIVAREHTGGPFPQDVPEGDYMFDGISVVRASDFAGSFGTVDVATFIDGMRLEVNEKSYYWDKELNTFVEILGAPESTLAGSVEPFTYKWQSRGAGSWVAPAPFTPDRDMVIKITWAATCYRLLGGLSGWDTSVTGAELLDYSVTGLAAPELRLFQGKTGTHETVSPVSGFYKCTAGTQVSVGYGTTLAGTESDTNDYFQIDIVEIGGPKGEPGDDAVGTDGKSAYQSWIDQGGFGDEAAFLLSLKGESGEDLSTNTARIDTMESRITNAETVDSGLVTSLVAMGQRATELESSTQTFEGTTASAAQHLINVTVPAGKKVFSYVFMLQEPGGVWYNFDPNGGFIVDWDDVNTNIVVQLAQTQFRGRPFRAMVYFGG